MAADNAHVTNQYLTMNGDQMQNLMRMMSETVAATLQQQQQYQGLAVEEMDEVENVVGRRG